VKENYQLNKKHVIIFLIACFLIFNLVVTYWISSDREADRENLNIRFAGSVKHIEYDIKQSPTITIGDSSYYIGSGYNTDHQIEVGDSMIKKVGQTYTG
jgi:hypothetical protein